MTYGPISHDQAKALAAFIHSIRTDWDKPGIEDAVGRARNRAPAPDLAIAAIRAAITGSNRTPAVIGLDGEHWRPAAPATTVLRPPRMDQECDRHPGEHAGTCRGCAADKLAGDELAARRKATDRATATDQIAELRRLRQQATVGFCSHGVAPGNCHQKHEVDA